MDCKITTTELNTISKERNQILIYKCESFGIGLYMTRIEAAEYIPASISRGYRSIEDAHKKLRKFKFNLCEPIYDSRLRSSLAVFQKKIKRFPSRSSRLVTDHSEYIRNARNTEFISEVSCEIHRTPNDSW